MSNIAKTELARKVRNTGTVFTVLIAVATCHMINDTLQAVLLSILPMLRDSFALTFTQIGLITMVFQITASVLQPMVGYFADLKAMPYSLPVAPAFTAGGLLLLGSAHSFEAVLVAAAIIGIGSSIFHPEASRVARLSSGGRFGMAQSVFQVGGNVGTAIGPLLAAAIVLPFGQSSITWFAALAVAALVLLFYVGRWYSAFLVSRATSPLKPVAQHGVGQSTVLASVGILIALMFSKFVYMACFHSFYTFYLIHEFGVSTRQAQIYLFVFLGAVALGTFIGGPIGDRIGRKAVIWFSILGTLPFALLMPHANLFGTVALTVPIGLILSSAFSAIVVYAQELMPGRVGMISGLFFGFAFGMGGLGAAVLGIIADHTSLRFVFELCSILPALGLLAYFLPSAAQLKSQH